MSRLSAVAAGAICLAILSHTAVAGEWLTDPADAVAEILARRAAEADIERKVSALKVNATLDRVPLRDAVEAWLKSSDVPFTWDDAAVQSDGVQIADPITLYLGPSTLSQALSTALASSGMDWFIDDGRLVLTTFSRASERVQIRFYPLVIDGPVPFTLERVFGPWSERLLTPSLELSQIGESWKSGPFGANESLASPSPEETAEVPRCWEHEFPSLVQEVTSGEWADVDGVGGSMQLVGRHLMVRQVRHVHEEIAGLLDQLQHWATLPSPRSSLTLGLRRGYPQEQEDAWRKALAERVTLQFRDVPLREVLVAIAAERHLPLYLDDSACQDEGIDIDARIAWSVENRPLREALVDLLQPRHLDGYLDEGRLVVTPLIGCRDAMETRLFDVSELAAAKHPEQLLELLMEATSGAWELLDGIGGSVLLLTPRVLIIRQTPHVQAEVTQFLEELRQLRVHADPPPSIPDPLMLRVYTLHDARSRDDLIRIIPQFVAPKSWTNEDDGPKIERLGEKLLIRQTRGVHALIARFLKTVDPPPTVQRPPE
jgi:hypothetical protein